MDLVQKVHAPYQFYFPWFPPFPKITKKGIMTQGVSIKSNLRKLNIAQISRITYSTIMLGMLLPKLNIRITRKKKKDRETRYRF